MNHKMFPGLPGHLSAAIVVGLLLGLSVTPGSAQSAGPFNLSWTALDGGGGRCAGGVGSSGRAKFSLSGTTGQPDAGTSIAGPYNLRGGFLPGFVTETGPALRILRGVDAVGVSWPAASCSGFRLEATRDLASATWVDLGEGALGSHERVVIVPLSTPYQFFRLRKLCAGNCPRVCPK